jgi:hypothetical protein
MVAERQPPVPWLWIPGSRYARPAVTGGFSLFGKQKVTADGGASAAKSDELPQA